jgi:hypothetical protein
VPPPSIVQLAASSGTSLPSAPQPTRPLNNISDAVWTPPFEVTAGLRLPGSELMATTRVPPRVGATVVVVAPGCCAAGASSSSLAQALATSIMASAATVRCFLIDIPQTCLNP